VVWDASLSKKHPELLLRIGKLDTTMAIPKQTEIEVPLLRALIDLGGEARPRAVYPLLEKQFGLSDADLAETLLHGESKWKNRVQWARQTLVSLGEIEKAGWGVWRVTEAGRRRVASASQSGGQKSAVIPQNLQATWELYEAAFRDRVLERLLGLQPAQFERFAREFLRIYGFFDLKVTATGPDGGIDGHGRLRVGVAAMSVAFQCKRWQGQVGRPEVDKFRGAIQGEFEQGIFFTTSSFSKPAKGASIKKGAVPVVLIDGEQLVAIMIEKDFGVAKRPLVLYEETSLPGVEEEEH
jgi:restriction system protein